MFQMALLRVDYLLLLQSLLKMWYASVVKPMPLSAITPHQSSPHGALAVFQQLEYAVSKVY
jgi:hypothetical protein